LVSIIILFPIFLVTPFLVPLSVPILTPIISLLLLVFLELGILVLVSPVLVSMLSLVGGVAVEKEEKELVFQRTYGCGKAATF